MDGIKSIMFCSGGKNRKMAKKVIDYKLLNGKKYYKVKWECTWELEDNLLSYKGLVDQFWDFVNRVKSEDNYELMNDKNNQESEDENNQISEEMPHVQISEEMPRVQIISDDKTSNELAQHCDGDQFDSLVSMIRKPLVNIKPVCKGENIVDENNIPNLPSMVTINPPRQELQIANFKNGFGSSGHSQHSPPVFKRIYGVLDHNTEENNQGTPEIIDLKLQRQTINVTNSDERRFQCHVCGMAFKRKDMCKRHLRTHTNDCCYFCAICKKGFIRRYVLVKHLNKDHQTNDQTKILSTKRRRRDDVKQEPIMKEQFLFKTTEEGMDILPTSEETVMESSETIDDEHDYDKKTENVVVVLRVETDDKQTESTVNPSTCEYSDNKLTGISDNTKVPIESSSNNGESSAFLKASVAEVSIPEHSMNKNITSVKQPETTPADGNYVIFNRSDSPPMSIQNTYNPQFSFSAKNPDINQQFSQ